MRLNFLARGLAAVCFVVVAAVSTAAPADEAPLATDAKALAETVQKQHGAGYATRIDTARHIVYVSAVDPRALDYVTKLLGEYADHQREFLFPLPLPWNVTVILPTVNDYRKSVPASSAAGRYAPALRTLESISFSDVLVHEFTHALHHADQAQASQRHPVWILEGLATLFQRAAWKDGRFKVDVDPSLSALQEALRKEKAPSLAHLCEMDQPAFLADAAVCYPASRYVMFYLYKQEKLKPFYETYKADYAADRTGATTLAKVLGKPLSEIDAEWRAWVLKLEPPWTPAHRVQAHLGVKMRTTDEGVEVAGFVRNSAAERGGVLRVGDVILAVDGQATPTAPDLTAAVQACKPGTTVEIEVVRGGEIVVVKQLLEATRP